MRKSIFMFTTNTIILVFLLLMISSNLNGILYQSYPSMTINEIGSDIDLAEFENSLSSLAYETDSVIARRVVTPTNQGTSFLYKKYGEGQLPPLFSPANEETVQRSDPANSYLIMSGNLSVSQLNLKLLEFANGTDRDARVSPPGLVLRLLSSDAILLACILFYLLYTSMSILSEISILRSSGIKILSGIRAKSLLYQNLLSNIGAIFMMAFLSLLFGALIMMLLELWNFQLFQILIAATILHSIVLVMITVFVKGLFSLLLQRTKLVELVKGKLPIKSILSVLMISHFIAFVVVGWSANQVQLYLPEAKKLMLANSAWKERDNLSNISYNLSAYVRDAEESKRRSKLWFDFWLMP